jgi:drug/metabolite transporter (DMT)-like permease
LLIASGETFVPTGILLALSAGTLISTLPLLSWVQGKSPARQIWMIVLGHALTLPALVIVTLALGAKMPSMAFIAVAAAAGACSGANGAIYYGGVMNRGPVSVSWAVIWLSAVIVAVFAWTFLGERIYFAQPFAIVCFLGCLTTMAGATSVMNRAAGTVQRVQRGYWTLLVTAMAVGVVGALFMKVHPEGEESLAGDVAFVTAYVFGLAAVLLAFALARRVQLQVDRRTMLTSVLWGLACVPTYVILVAGLRGFPASVMLPTYSGTALVLGVAWAMLRGERPHWLVYVGASLALLSIVLINWH